MRITCCGAVSPVFGRRVRGRRRAVQNVEHQAAGDRAGFREPNLDLLCQAKRDAGPAACQCLLPLIMVPEIVGQ